jgi:hypothetical protein
MSKFEIKNFFQFEDGSAKFSLNTEAGFYYEMKLVAYSGGHFITSAQSRPYDKSDGSKGYANAFGALKDSPAAKFFDEVAEGAKKLLRSSAGNANNTGQSGNRNNTTPNETPPYDPDDDIPF